MNLGGIFAASIRGLSSVARFALVLYLARNVDLGTMGAYGLIAAVCALVVQFVGLEFHYYNTRAILAVRQDARGRLIRDQGVLHLFSYVAVLPWLGVLFSAGVLDWKYALYFFPLVVMEHIGQEIFRVLQTCFRPVLATVVLFIRTGLWVFVFLVVMEFIDNSEPLEKLLLIWLTFSALSVCIGLFGLRSEISIESFRLPIEWGWIRNGVKRSMPFLMTTVCYTAMQYMDRFVLEYFRGNEAVGIFFFFSSLASFFNVVLTFSIGIFHGPRIIYAYQNLGLNEYRKERSLLIKKYLLVGGSILMPAIGAIYIVLWAVAKGEYYDHIHIYWILLAASVVLTISDFVNFDLYVRGHDKEIMWSAVIGSLIALMLQVIFVSKMGITGAAIATAISYIVLGIVRYMFLRNCRSTSPETR